MQTRILRFSSQRSIHRFCSVARGRLLLAHIWERSAPPHRPVSCSPLCSSAGRAMLCSRAVIRNMYWALHGAGAGAGVSTRCSRFCLRFVRVHQCVACPCFLVCLSSLNSRPRPDFRARCRTLSSCAPGNYADTWTLRQRHVMLHASRASTSTSTIRIWCINLRCRRSGTWWKNATRVLAQQLRGSLSDSLRSVVRGAAGLYSTSNSYCS